MEDELRPACPSPLDATQSRGAELIKREYLDDVLLCPEYDGRRRISSFIIDPIVIRKILVHSGLPTEVPQRAGPRAVPGSR